MMKKERKKILLGQASCLCLVFGMLGQLSSDCSITDRYENGSELYAQIYDALVTMFFVISNPRHTLHRLPDLLWLWHVAQRGTPAFTPVSFNWQRDPERQQEQQE